MNEDMVVGAAADCKSELIESTTLNECENKCYIPMGRCGPLVVKIPVVLADIKVQIDVESQIKLSDQAFDIKTVDKKIHLTQCKVVPHTDKLFIGGYIQKNIQFSTVKCINKTSISGNIQHTTANIPFNCVTKIKFYRKPMYGSEYKERIVTLDKKMMGADEGEDSWIHFSKLYEPVFCELESAEIFETDIHCDNADLEGNSKEWKSFEELTEKMVIHVRIKILQKQQVYIPKYDAGIEILDASEEGQENAAETNNLQIEVGYNSEKGMVFGKVLDSNQEED